MAADISFDDQTSRLEVGPEEASGNCNAMPADSFAGLFHPVRFRLAGLLELPGEACLRTDGAAF